MEVLFIFSQLPMLAGGGMLIVSISPLKVIIGKLKNSGGQGYALWGRGGSFL